MTTATRARPSRPSATRGGRGNTARVAHDLGRRGEAAPSWVGDSPAYADAYERGVSARDAAEAGAARPDAPEPEDDSAAVGESDVAADVSTSGAGSGAHKREPAPGSGTTETRDGPSPRPAPAPRLFRRRVADALTAPGVFAGRPGVDDAAGLVLGVILYGNLVAALRDPISPMHGVRSWWAAKFFNHTAATAAAATASPSAGLVSLLVSPQLAATPRVPPTTVPAPAASYGTYGDLLLGRTPAPKPAVSH